MNTKICRVCNIEKDIEQFYIAKENVDNRRNECNDCSKKIYSHNFDEKYYEDTQNNLKICRVCNSEKPLKEFHRRKDSTTGYRTECIECTKLKNITNNTPDKTKQYREKNHEQVLESTRNWRNNNPQHIKDYVKKYKEENSEIIKVRSNKWKNEHKEDIKKYNANYIKENYEHVRELKKKNYDNNRENILLRSKLYKLNNKEKCKIGEKKYDEKRKNASGRIEWKKNYQQKDETKARRRNHGHKRRAKMKETDVTKEWLVELRKQITICPILGVEMVNDGNVYPNGKTEDHIIPLNIGGKHVKSNIRIISRQANNERPKNGSDLIGTEYEQIYLDHLKNNTIL